MKNERALILTIHIIPYKKKRAFMVLSILTDYIGVLFHFRKFLVTN